MFIWMKGLLMSTSGGCARQFLLQVMKTMCRLFEGRGIGSQPNYKMLNNFYKEQGLCDLGCNMNFGEPPPFSFSVCFLVGV